MKMRELLLPSIACCWLHCYKPIFQTVERVHWFNRKWWRYKKSNQVGAIQAQSCSLLRKTWISKTPRKIIEKYKVQVQVTRLFIQQTAHGKKSNQVSAIQVQSFSLLRKTWISKTPRKIIEKYKVQVQVTRLFIQQTAHGKKSNQVSAIRVQLCSLLRKTWISKNPRKITE